jgi:ABC-type nitrate/sulfonate/bicarbonate transport system permease component
VIALSRVEMSGQVVNTMLMGLYRRVKYIVDPYIGASLASPKIVFVLNLCVLFGLGALLRMYVNRFDSARVFAIPLVVIGVALLCSAAMRVLEDRFTAWTEEGA